MKGKKKETLLACWGVKLWLSCGSYEDEKAEKICDRMDAGIDGVELEALLADAMREVLCRIKGLGGRSYRVEVSK